MKPYFRFLTFFILFLAFHTKIMANQMQTSLQPSLDEILYPALEPFDQGFLKVSNIHTLWYAQYGNPQGVPVIVLHGGPGFGCNTEMRFFDLQFYRVILLDQRGANRSKPSGELKENTTDNLIADLEALRKYLKIKQWLVFGGSWGSTLALAYGQTHPDKCLGFILRGIFLGRKCDAHQLWYGIRAQYPDVWQEFADFIPLSERNDLITAYEKRFNDSDPKVHYPAALAFMKYDLTCSYALTTPNLDKLLGDKQRMLSTTRIFTHYCRHDCFLEKNQLLNNIHKINHLPAIIVHGRFDVITLPSNAYALYQQWPGAQLVLVQEGGHASLEPGIAKALVQATEKMKSLTH